MSPLQAIILGIVEGVTEYLPVSSTGHLIIVAWLLGLDHPPETKAAVDAFAIVVQGGAILAVLGLYRSRVMQMIRGVVGRDRAGRRLAINILVAFAPAAIFGTLLDKRIERHLFHPAPVIAALFVGGLVLIGIRRWQERALASQRRDDAADGADAKASPEPESSFISIDELTVRQALLIGLLQCVAMWPGTSRSMVTIVGGMVVGMRPRDAAEFSFLLGLPTLGGACVYKLAKNLDAHGLGFIETLGGWTPVLLGIAAATISAAFAVKWLVGYLSRHDMALFGWYRIALATVLAALVWGFGVEVGK